MAKDKNNCVYDPRLCKKIHDNLDEKIDTVQDNLNNRMNHLEDQYNNLHLAIENLKNDIKDEIQTTEKSINLKLDTIDLTLRGNGKVGLQEQSRALNRKFYLCFVLILLLLGFRFFGAKLTDIKNELMGNQETKQQDIYIENQKDNMLENAPIFKKEVE